MQRPTIQSDAWFRGGPSYYAFIKEGHNWLYLRRDGSLKDCLHDYRGYVPDPVTIDWLNSLPNSAWFKDKAECEANLEKWFPTKKTRKPRKKRVYYKVLRKRGDTLISAAPGLPYDLQLVYTPGEVRIPGRAKSKLYVFGKLESAQSFVKNELSGCGGTYRIYECEVTNPHKTKLLACASEASYLLDALDKARKVKKAVRSFIKLYWMRSVPSDSYSVDSVKLIKEVV